MNETFPGRSAATSFYKSGGTLSPDEPSYVARSADRELHDRLSEGQFCYVLTSRQMGKSSLMNRVATRLHREGTAVAEIDLTTIGQNLTIDQWYDGLIYEIGRRANVKAQLRASWQSNANLGPLQRFITTLREGLLTTFFQPVVIFVDEIEVVRSLPFSTDEFFAAIRECYNRRASDPEMRRLTFCLLGMATPPDLIQDPRITPFNIGKRIELTDFTFAEARPLAAGMCDGGRDGGRDGERLLKRVLYWTSGQPYLTQRLCQAVAEDPTVTGEAGVDELCRKLYLSEQARESEPNLVPLREYVLRSAPDRAAVLDLYQKIRAGKRVPAGAADVNVSILQLAGITRAQRGRLVVKNRIYASVFDRRWVRANMPEAELRRQRAAAIRAFAISGSIFGSITLIAVAALIAFIFQLHAANRLQHHLSVELYVADMNRAGDALNRHDVASVDDSLKTHVGDPMIGFEYGYLWRESHQAYYTSPNAANAITCVSFSPDGHYVAGASVSSGVQIIDVAERQVVRTINTGLCPYPSALFSSRCGYLAVIDSGSIDVLDARTWSVIRVLRPPVPQSSTVTCMAIDSTGHKLAAGTNYGRVLVYDPTTGRLLSTESSTELLVLSAAFSPATGQLATAGTDGIIRLWNPSTGGLAKTIVTRLGAIRSLTFNKWGSRLAASGEGRLIAIWDTGSWETERTISVGDEIIYGLAYVPSTGELAAGGADNVVELWNTDTQEVDRELNGHSLQIHAVACSTDGHWLASAGWDGTVKIWDLHNQQQVQIRDLLPGDNHLTLSRDGEQVAGLLPQNIIAVWNSATGNQEAAFPANSAVVALSLNGLSKEIAVANTHDAVIRDLRTGAALWHFHVPDPITYINRASLSPDGTRLAIGGVTGEVEIWEAPGRLVNRLQEHGKSSITALAWSDHGDMLAVAESPSSSVKVYSLDSTSAPIQLVGHHAPISSLAFTSDGREIASCSTDATLKFWNLETAREVLTIPTAQTQPYSIAFSEVGKRISLVAEDGIIYTWESTSAADVAAALARN